MARTGRPKLSKDVECECIKCGKHFLVREWQAKDGRGKFCSRECYESPGPHRARPSLVVEPTRKICEQCQREYLIGGLAHRGSYSSRFCSISCASRYNYRRGKLKGGSPKGRIRNHQVGYFERLNRTIIPTPMDIAWTAGWFDGEGWCSLLKNPDGSPKTQHVGLGQKDRWICDRLRDLFGGYVSDNGVELNDRIVGKRNLKGLHKGYAWHIHGPRARGFLMTVYKFLSPRRQKRIREVLSANHETS